MNLILRDLKTSDLPLLADILTRIAVFDQDDRGVALDLLRIILEQPDQKDYLCIVAAEPAEGRRPELRSADAETGRRGETVGAEAAASEARTADSTTPVGYACFGPTPLTEGTFDLYWIAVDPACAGQGIGSRLLRAVEEQVRQARGRLLVLETSSTQCYAQTRQFYLKSGYSLAETIRDFYREGEDRVTYLKRM